MGFEIQVKRRNIWVCFDFLQLRFDFLNLCFDFLAQNRVCVDFFDLCFEFRRVCFDFVLDLELLFDRGKSVSKLHLLAFQNRNKRLAGI